jgi:hypothetical protein
LSPEFPEENRSSPSTEKFPLGLSPGWRAAVGHGSGHWGPGWGFVWRGACCPEEQYPGARPRIAAVYSGTPDTDGTAESSEHNWRLRPPGGEPNGRGTKDERT